MRRSAMIFIGSALVDTHMCCKRGRCTPVFLIACRKRGSAMVAAAGHACDPETHSPRLYERMQCEAVDPNE